MKFLAHPLLYLKTHYKQVMSLEGMLTISSKPNFEKNYGTVEDFPLGYEQWPDFSYVFIQDAGRFISVDRGHGLIGNGAWSITAGVDAVWDEANDNCYTRCSSLFSISNRILIRQISSSLNAFF